MSNRSYKAGDHLFQCDEDGMVYRISEGRYEWTGALVHKKNWSPRNPQDLIKSTADKQAVRDTRSVPADQFITTPVTPEDL